MTEFHLKILIWRETSEVVSSHIQFIKLHAGDHFLIPDRFKFSIGHYVQSLSLLFSYKLKTYPYVLRIKETELLHFVAMK